MTSGPISRKESQQIDKTAIERFGFPGCVLMENAGRGCVDLLEKLRVRGPVLIAAGHGNNGGDGLVIARHLALRGHECGTSRPSARGAVLPP